MAPACSAAAATTSGTPCPRHETMAPPEQALRMRRPAAVVDHTPSPRSMFGYGRSRNRGNTLVSSDRIVPDTLPAIVARLLSRGPLVTDPGGVARRRGGTIQGAATTSVG